MGEGFPSTIAVAETSAVTLPSVAMTDIQLRDVVYGAIVDGELVRWGGARIGVSA